MWSRRGVVMQMVVSGRGPGRGIAAGLAALLGLAGPSAWWAAPARGASAPWAAAPNSASVQAVSPAPTLWILDSLESIGGHPVAVVGAPRLVRTDLGPAVEFDGRGDGLFLDVNPLAGLERFTVEVTFEPLPGGAEEQRFLHVQEAASEDRALVELRVLPDGRWCLDTFLRRDGIGLTLIDRAAAHPLAGWHVAALVYDGRTMAHYVDGRREAAGPLAFRPLGPGRTSIGVRQNRVSWFRGRIHAIRIVPEAVAPRAVAFRVVIDRGTPRACEGVGVNFSFCHSDSLDAGAVAKTEIYSDPERGRDR